MSGPTLIAAASAAIAAIGEAGGSANTIALSPTAYAAEMSAVDANGRLIHEAGLDRLLGLGVVKVPTVLTPRCSTTGAAVTWFWVRTRP